MYESNADLGLTEPDESDFEQPLYVANPGDSDPEYAPDEITGRKVHMPIDEWLMINGPTWEQPQTRVRLREHYARSRRN